MTTSTREPNTIRIYACGGLATNVVSSIGDRTNQRNMANLEACYLDTSNANITARVNPNSVFIVKGPNGESLDGSGGVHGLNLDAIAASSKQMLSLFKPQRFNLVVATAHGGTGAMIAAMTMKNLLEAGEFVIGVFVFGDESEIRAINSRNVARTMDNLARNVVKRPFLCHPVLAARGASWSTTDNAVIRAIGKLAVLMSGTFHQLDTQDIRHWMDYTKIPSIKDIEPQFCVVDILDGNAKVNEYKHDIISVASLYTNIEVAMHTAHSRYDTMGFGDIPHMEGLDGLHFVVSASAVITVYDHLTTKAKEQTDEHSSKVHRGSIVEKDAKVSSHGIVLE